MFALSDIPSPFALPQTSRLRWLVQLRWVALGGVAVALGVSQAARFPWVSPGPIAVVLGAGVLYNVLFYFRLRRLELEGQRVGGDGTAGGRVSDELGASVSAVRELRELSRGDAPAPSDSGAVPATQLGPEVRAASPRRGLWYFRRLGERLSGERPRSRDATSRPPSSASARTMLGRELELHALADVGALTLLLWASGGVHNPACMFYGFHVVLGAMLGYVRGALFSATVGLLGIWLLVLAERANMLLAEPLFSPPLWLMSGAAILTICSLVYFALGVLRFVEREQGRALRNYDLLLSALDTLKVGLELVAPDGRLLLANRRAAIIHPCPDGQWAMPAGEGGGEPEADSSAAGRHDPRLRRLAHTEAGETRIFEMLALSDWDQTNAGIRAFVYVDRTEATVDEQRAIMLERLASLGRAMQDVAHELNTPLASIQTLAVDLSHAVTTPDAAESIALIVDEARRCREISRELLGSARIGPQSPVRTVLAEVVRRAARLAYGRQRSGVILQGDLDLTCVTDGDRLLQILVNLLQNASDASEQPVEVTIEAIAPGPDELAAGAVRVRVRDHGPGLPPEVLARLYTPFVTTKPPGKGTGLGLYTCARLAQQLRARLTIENAAAGGVLAQLTLPR